MFLSVSYIIYIIYNLYSHQNSIYCVLHKNYCCSPPHITLFLNTKTIKFCNKLNHIHKTLHEIWICCSGLLSNLLPLRYFYLSNDNVPTDLRFSIIITFFHIDLIKIENCFEDWFQLNCYVEQKQFSFFCQTNIVI